MVEYFQPLAKILKIDCVSILVLTILFSSFFRCLFNSLLILLQLTFCVNCFSNVFLKFLKLFLSSSFAFCFEVLCGASFNKKSIELFLKHGKTLPFPQNRALPRAFALGTSPCRIQYNCKNVKQILQLLPKKKLLVELCLPPCCQQATQMLFLTSNVLSICTHAVCAFATQCSCWRILPFLPLQFQNFFKQKHVSLEKRHSL